MIFLGRIQKTRGNKGEVVVQPSSHMPDEGLEEGTPVLLKSAKYQKSKHIQHCRSLNGSMVIKFREINTIEEAFKLVGYSLFGSGSEIQQPTPDSILNYQVKDINEKKWGIVTRMIQEGPNTLLEIQLGDKTFLVPFHPSIVLETDHNELSILIDPPEGLMELNQE